ncbi:glycine betaine ABC transporter substrate-binding protein [Limosilactobacillus fermentum]
MAAAAKKGVAKYKLTTRTPAPGNDSQGIAVTTKVAKKYGLYTISDLQKKANKIRFVSQGELDQRLDALPGMVKKYGKFDFKSSKDYDDSLKYKILSEGKGDAAPVSTTDGQLANGNKYTLLKDDKHLWPAYTGPVGLLGYPRLRSHPKMAKALNQVDRSLHLKP